MHTKLLERIVWKVSSIDFCGFLSFFHRLKDYICVEKTQLIFIIYTSGNSATHIFFRKFHQSHIFC